MLPSNKQHVAGNTQLVADNKQLVARNMLLVARNKLVVRAFLWPVRSMPPTSHIVAPMIYDWGPPVSIDNTNTFFLAAAKVDT